MTRVAIALGSNLGDRLGNLRAAVAALEEAGVAVVRRSFAWETPPVPADQPPFLNAAVLAETDLPPASLLAALKGIEHALGRRPGRRWGPRPIDLDILFYGDLRLETPDLTIPHPRIAERAFVLAPLAEILEDPLPVLGASALELLQTTGLQGARRLCAL
ncbi:2-amino-4-hydroxy-6-hydroxymethyldihydropteridine diphosphokinase [Tepidiforma thermophila]|uniref:2-amino-4-hydroxy-6-hydroxymethyldihydropteridine diphosphokinase n=1 Tax=Tepidiforma thermophila (strain KCTC 52669 / CGMCC 1.13589 / G233) TaxID=2761530 RepID=A0A2A9HDD5_TEPT2|nr:2-amino-4-hydroxy-6-hydroxymethyldihydropteridine diphosphokinase [Tepidiforma thermophila]PFG73994.1 2-amino-4-hydroxy-6-hydroxymethyldihydropteridine diphosphokinase/2-amino-4-hydroxy-6-hydroxymethyldihydropteridine diphosphokinase/dihydropteroate synthase [Tepidiforma thermophila]